ncbi:MAG: DUF3800 domain-containing protein [Hyphomicrobiales bacterium]|nr:DUF3800 domain-containing protein [Hyphomicrobiales bacterium]MDE2114759.1 DUF3800 domain-containing protein [Hyphomicrobiales bacterium]
MADEMAFGDYVVFIDESGDPNLVKIDQEFPVFALVFVIIEKREYAKTLVPALKYLKFRFWGHDAIVIHAHEIRKPRGDTAFLMTSSKRDVFMAAINKIMQEAPIKIIACVIQKANLRNRYITPYDPYHIALGLCMERLSLFLHENSHSDRMTHLIAEARGAREDRELELEFRRYMDGKGRIALNAKAPPCDLKIVSKIMNIEGLQLADLVAHPIARHVLRPEQDSRAFEIIKGKIWDGASTRGLKVFP